MGGKVHACHKRLLRACWSAFDRAHDLVTYWCRDCGYTITVVEKRKNPHAH